MSGRTGVALVLAVGAAVGVIVLCLGAVFHDGDPVSWSGSVLLTTALGALIGAVSVYLGSTLARTPGDRDRAADRLSDRDDPGVDT